MPVNSAHSDYEDRKKQWERSRDSVEGTDAVKDRGTEYLPKLSKQSVGQYDAYRERALFYGASGRTVQGLLGAVLRKDPNYIYPSSWEHLIENSTLDGLSIWDLIRIVLKESLTTGRQGILVDVPEEENEDDAYLAHYFAEDIVNWRTEKVGSSNQLVLVVLREFIWVAGKDEFLREKKEQYRILKLIKIDESFVYSQEIWVKRGKKEEFELDKTTIPNKRGVPLDFIPFQFINAYDLTTNIQRPPLLDLIDVNLSHYRTSADLEHGAHFTALPTAWVAGFDTTKELHIGSAVAWVSNNPQATAGFLEFKGQGLESLRNLKKDKEQLMAVLGARLLEESKKGVEAAETLKLRVAGENGALGTISNTASEGILNVLLWQADWSGVSESQINTIEFQLNTDFISAEMEPQKLTALMQAWQGGGISMDTFLDNLKRGEVLPQDRTIEEEKDMIAAEEDKIDTGSPIPLKREFELVRDENGDTKGIKEA